MLPAITFVVRFGKFNPQRENRTLPIRASMPTGNNHSLCHAARVAGFHPSLSQHLQPLTNLSGFAIFHLAEREIAHLYFGVGKAGIA